MRLWLTPEQARAISDHCRREMPYEACGLLLGKDGTVTRIIAARNVDPQPRTGFVVAPEDLFAALNQAEREQLDLIGAYHSHPAGRPIPSARDIREAYYPDTVQIIIGLGSGAPEMAGWLIRDGRVRRAELVVQSQRPAGADFVHTGLTPAQRVATIAAGIIAVAIVVAAALALLPPPYLPT